MCKVYDDTGALLRRVNYECRQRLVDGGIADPVGATNHVRLKLGVEWIANPLALHGLNAVELSRRLRGDAETRRDIMHLEKFSLR